MANENVVDQIWFEIFQSSQGNVYILVTWCPITSAWLPTRKGVWFTPWVTDKKCFTYFVHFTLSDAILKSERGRILCLCKEEVYLGVDKKHLNAVSRTLFRGGSRGRVQGVRPPPLPLEMTCGFVIQLVFCKKKTMWFIGVEVEQETSAPPPKKNPGSAPAF